MWSLILPDAIAPFLLIILMTYIRGIPEELEEAAVVEGCSYWRILTRIVVPISKPVLATLTIFYAVGHWNQYFQALIYISDPDKYTLQLRLQIILDLWSSRLQIVQDRTGLWIVGSGRRPGRRDRHSNGADRVDLSVLAKVLHQGGHAGSDKGLRRRHDVELHAGVRINATDYALSKSGSIYGGYCEKTDKHPGRDADSGIGVRCRGR